MSSLQGHDDKTASLPQAYASAVAGQRNAAVLAVCQGLFTCAISIDLTLTALTGWQLAPDKALATLPFALITVAGAVVTWFAAFLIQRLGRRLSFALGAGSCCVGGLVSVWSVFNAHFWSFCVGTAMVGVFQAFAQYYRLAAADAVAEQFKSRAISTVLAGGVIAAIVGPALASWSRDLFPTALFAGAYLVVAAMGLLSVLVLLAFYRDLDAPQATADASVAASPPRPLGAIARTPVFMASVANNVAGSMVMMFIMTAAPLAAVACHHGIDDGAAIIQWHLVGMYAPSFFAGALIRRIGLGPVLLAGLGLNLGCALIAMASPSLPAFYAALLLLGIGWNFMFVGGTTLLAQSYTPSERAKTQGFSELLRYAATALATLGAGPLLARFGWETLNAAILPILLLSALATARWMLGQRAARAQAAGSMG
ncbi:MFS transporter [Herbaspirillum sp. LeCh32-8]|uniref:MFS transporter n=1 Tax=Herbaspirillum sp. LeCh32-8 TaxID=2821356 RepID=UPI001AE4C737|nr:MFS transporter [Herbaspirillum sp. LeCh32-8]MBP0600557.1 MFS transporter [Herbaspirillum sp. LeCh32-8]